MLAAIEIDRDDAAVRWLDQRQASRMWRVAIRAPVAHRFRIARRSPWRSGTTTGNLMGESVVACRSPGSKPRRVPVAAPHASRHHASSPACRPDPSLTSDGGVNIGPITNCFAELARLRPQRRREVDQIVLGQPLAIERRRLGRERLRRRGLFARHRRLRHRPFLDRPHRLAGHAIEDVQEAVLLGCITALMRRPSTVMSPSIGGPTLS